MFHNNKTWTSGTNRLGWARVIACAVVLLAIVGCDRGTIFSSQSASLQPTSLATRAQRRAFDGAPPVIAHEAFGIACAKCHGEQGKLVPTVGLAPANPHWGDRRDGAFTNCSQCHVFAQSDSVFVASNFQGLQSAPSVAERAFPGAPPVVPHPLTMRANCNACHADIAARPEIRCTHPERTNCVQCHVASGSDGDFTKQLGEE